MADTIGQQFDTWRADVERRLTALEKKVDPDQPPGDFTPPALSEVRWHDQDISAWPETSRIDEEKAEWRGGRQHFPHSKAGQWPTQANGLEGNPWVIFKFAGAWQAMTWEWLNRGQVSKGIPADLFDEHLSFPGRVPGWGPKAGEWYGWCVSAVARHGQSAGAKERTQIVWRRWP